MKENRSPLTLATPASRLTPGPRAARPARRCAPSACLLTLVARLGWTRAWTPNQLMRRRMPQEMTPQELTPQELTPGCQMPGRQMRRRWTQPPTLPLSLSANGARCAVSSVVAAGLGSAMGRWCAASVSLRRAAVCSTRRSAALVAAWSFPSAAHAPACAAAMVRRSCRVRVSQQASLMPGNQLAASAKRQSKQLSGPGVARTWGCWIARSCAWRGR